MVITFLNPVLDYVKTSSTTFDFSVDFDGNVEYIRPVTVWEDEEELLIKFLIEGGHIPLNERTEGHISVDHGKVEVYYSTCLGLGEDYTDDTWVDGNSSVTIS